VAKSVDTASSISIHLHYYNCNHYYNDCQGAKYVDTNIPDKGSPAKFLCSVIMPRGVGPGGLWCVCVVFVQVCVCDHCVCVCNWCMSEMYVCVYVCVCMCDMHMGGCRKDSR